MGSTRCKCLTRLPFEVSVKGVSPYHQECQDDLIQMLDNKDFLVYEVLRLSTDPLPVALLTTNPYVSCVRDVTKERYSTQKQRKVGIPRVGPTKVDHGREMRVP